MKKILLIASLTFLSGNVLQAQQTGNFNATINFNGANRTLANFVPTTYDATQPYHLVIGLHGLGDQATNYRNALTSNILNFAAAFPNTILVCPDGGNDQLRDFYTPLGDEQIIEEAIQYARTNYNIDTNNIILQGFSLGGRSALRYGLENPDGIKALLLNTPAIQGVKEAANLATNFTYNLSNASALPIFITLGNGDDNYVEPINTMVANLVAGNAKLSYRIFTGGHNVPSFQDYPYTAFFNAPYSSGLDAGLYRLDVPVRSCGGALNDTKVLLQNTGNAALTDVKLVYGIGTDKDTLDWQGNLNTHESAEIQLPVYNVANSNATNTYDFEVNVLNLNQTFDDTFAVFNTTIHPIHFQKEVLSFPFAEQFDTDDDLKKWAYNNSGDYILPFEYYEEDGALYSLNSIFIFDNSNTREEVISPSVNLTGEQAAYLHFNVDYNYTKYTADVFGIDTVFADTLEVLVSTDCGETYTSVFKKAGADLSGHDAPILNPLNIQTLLVEKDESKYKNFTVDVSPFAGNGNVDFKFSYISNLGGYIYLDDVLVNSSPVSLKKVEKLQAKVDVFPNPTNGNLNVTLGEGSISNLQVFNLLGQQVMKSAGSKTTKQTIDVGHLAKGTYLLLINVDGKQAQQKIVLQ